MVILPQLPHKAFHSLVQADLYILPFLIRFVPVLRFFRDFELIGDRPRLKAFFEAARKLDFVVKTTLRDEYYLTYYGEYATMGDRPKVG